jgi:hypothetical protein
MFWAVNSLLKKSYIMTDGQSASVSWCQELISDPRPNFLLSFIIFLTVESVDVGRPFWREVGSIVLSCFWASPAETFLGLSPAGLMTITYLRMRLNQPKSRSHVTTHSQSVSQYVKVSSPLWDLWPDITFCPKVAVLSLWGALSDERSGLSFSVCSTLSVFTSSINVTWVLHFSNL